MKPCNIIKKITSSISLKLGSALVVAAIFLGAVVIFLTTNFYSAYLIQISEDMQKQLLKSQTDQVHNKLQDYYKTVYTMAVDKDIRSLLLQLNSAMDSSIAQNRLLTKFYNSSSLNKDVLAITAISSNGNIAQYNRTRDIYRIPPETYFGGNVLEEIIQKSVCQNRLFLVEGKRELEIGKVFHIAIPLYNYYTKIYMGTLISTVNVSGLNDILQNNNPDSSNISYSIITLADGSILNEGILFDDMPSEQYVYEDSFLGDRENKIIISSEVDRYGTKLINVLDKKVLLSGVMRLQRTMIYTILFVLILYVFVLMLIVSKISSSSKVLISTIKEVEKGSLTARAKTNANDEFGYIATAFNKMLERLNEAQIQKEAQNKLNIDSLNKQREAEVKALESQINSHFLSNTLNVINYTAIEGGNHEVARLIKELSLTLRYTFNKSGYPVSVDDEIIWLHRYLHLQKQRFGKVFEYSIKTSPSVKCDQIRKLLIQPFVENSILHGFSGVRYGGLLEIKINRYKKDKLVISIKDNGIGMTNAQTESIRKLFKSGIPPQNMGIGIENVTFRIRKYYGDDAKFFISSHIGAGTRILIVLGKLGLV